MMSWPHLKVDRWDDHDLIRGHPSDERSHRSIYDDDDDPTSDKLK